MAKVMVTLRLPPERASLDEVRRLLELGEDEVDRGFGVVNISPAEHLYTILVEEAVAARVRDRDPVTGVYSNPRIEPQGPPAS
jgi:hypothetical protein